MFKILFIGIGNMGFPMAGYLSKLNKVTVYNRSKEKIDKWLSIFEGKSIKSLSEINWKAKINIKTGLEKTFLRYFKNKTYFKHLSKKDILNRLGKNG